MSFAGWAEILIIALLAFVIIGPKDLPKVLFIIGRFIKNMRRLSHEFMSEFETLYTVDEGDKNKNRSKSKNGKIT